MMVMNPLTATFLAALIGTAASASCGSSGIPFRFEVLPSGQPVLGCGSPTCFGAENGGRDLRHDSSFMAGADGDDGFFRDGDLARVRVRDPDAPAQMANCPREFSSSSCSNPMTWVGGFKASDNGDLSLQCCHYEGLRFAQEVGRPVVHPGEVYSGGEVLRDGRQTGFDAISNVRKITSGDGTVAYEVTVTRMNCLPNPGEESNEVSFDIQRDIGRILDKVGETAASGVQTNHIEADQRLSPSTDVQSDSYVSPTEADPQEPVEQFVQVGEQVVPVTSAGYYYPVASGVPACFTGNSKVMTPAGEKSMADLSVGDMVMTYEYGKMTYTRVASWLHRLPDTKAAFIKLTTEQGAIIDMTPQHFIYKANCVTEEMELVYAEDMTIGDCLMVKENEKLVMTTISEKSTFYETGVYAPMTETGDLIVDDVYASCHNVVKANTLSHTFLNFATSVQQKMRSVLGSLEETGHLPATSEFFLNIIDVLLPHKY
uniref:Warthog protein 1 n=2 Tax=Caenorhabditis elegans TaxID=6239 RepID=WRT1_CAEEL|nr:RecName: Full=Warthog protein 1; Contains: RecName: Full=Warthog protein 1 N-product; Contains: RecName: Full=Warthog protein 1 C-product; Flags: Precursor [Caenorhabditis elegans]AAB17540.1 ZK [Caenorhabditis elegans]